MLYTSNDIKTLGTILTIWAHPDDETWCAGGIMATAVANGQRVICITATRGDAGQTADEDRWPQAQLGSIRETELRNALQAINVDEHHWLDHIDGQLSTIDSTEGVERLAEYIRTNKPNTIVSFGPDGITGHPDHCTISEWALQAHQQTKIATTLLQATETTETYQMPISKACDEKFNIHFNTTQPHIIPWDDADIHFMLPPRIHQQKIAALKSHECQTAALFADPVGQEYLQTTTNHEAFMRVPE